MIHLPRLIYCTIHVSYRKCKHIHSVQRFDAPIPLGIRRDADGLLNVGDLKLVGHWKDMWCWSVHRGFKDEYVEYDKTKQYKNSNCLGKTMENKHLTFAFEAIQCSMIDLDLLFTNLWLENGFQECWFLLPIEFRGDSYCENQKVGSYYNLH